MAFRLEYARSGRAGCKATECKSQGIKIEKGELRHCTFLDIADHQSWAYKHWGCVTPVNIASLKKSIENNLDYLDGYEDLTDEDKAKIRQDGHINDSDWRYDVEMNRPGMKGFRTPEHKQRQRAEKKAAEEQSQSESPSKPAPKRFKGGKDSGAEAKANGEPSAKKRRTRVKKEATNGAEANDTADDAPQKKRTRVKKEELDEEEAFASTNDNLKRGGPRRAPKRVKKEVTGPKEENDIDISTRKKGQNRAKQTATTVKTEDVTTEYDSSEVEPEKEVARPPRTTAQAKKASAKVKLEVMKEPRIKEEGTDLDEYPEASDETDPEGGRKKRVASTIAKEPAPTTSGRVTRSMRA